MNKLGALSHFGTASMRFRFVPLIGLLLAFVVSGAQAQSFSSLEERMSAAEFKAAGLDKLSPEELAALNDWLRAKGVSGASFVAPAAVAPVEDRRGFPVSIGSSSDKAIVSRIQGEFRGWDGTATQFTLENGQVWKSTDPAARLSVRLNDPVVVIRPGVLNSWFLQVEGYNAKVRVVRVR